MSAVASIFSPIERLRVAVRAADPQRRMTLGKVVAEAGHVVVGPQDPADVVLVDGDNPAGETRPVVSLGGADEDLPGLLRGDADANQIDAAIRAVAAGLVVRLPGPRENGFGAMGETLACPPDAARTRSAGGARRRHDQQGHCAAPGHLAAHREIPRRIAVPETRRAHRTEAVAKASERRRYETITL